MLARRETYTPALLTFCPENVRLKVRGGRTQSDKAERQTMISAAASTKVFYGAIVLLILWIVWGVAQAVAPLAEVFPA